MATADENMTHPRNLRKTLPAMKSPHSLTDETKINTMKNERTARGRPLSAASFNQLFSGVPRIRGAQREDVVPIVTYDGVEDTIVCADKAKSSYSHREVKVVVHKSSSSSSSACSSVRSFVERTPAARHRHGRPRDQVPFSTRHEIEEENSTQSDGIIAEINSEPIQMSTNSCSYERKEDYEETIQLQVLHFTEGAAQNKPSDEIKQDEKKLGGSLADMFDS